MAEEFSGFSNEQVRNAATIKDSMAEINNLTKLYNKELGRSEEIIADVATEYRGIKAGADQVKNIQEKAAKSSAATAKAIEQQNKQLNIVARLNARIDRLYNASKKATGETKDNLLAQARVLTAARDKAASLADSFEQLADDSAKLTKSNYVFSTLAELAKDVPGLRTLAGPFEAAAEASRKTTLENAKQSELREKLGKVTEAELKNGKGLTKDRIKQLGLEKDLGNLTGRSAAQRLKTLKKSSKTSSSMMAGLNAGAKALGPALSKAFAPLAIAQAIISAIKFVFDSMMAADKKIVSISRNLGLSYENSKKIKTEFTEIASQADKMYLTFDRVAQAQEDLQKELGVSVRFSDDMLESVVSLQHRFGLAAGEAVKVTKIVKSIAGNSEEGLQAISEHVNELRRAGETAMGFDDVLQDIAKSSAETRAYYGGTLESLTKSVTSARRLGMSLAEAHNMGKGLNDVQESFVAQSNLAAIGLGDINVQRALELKAQGKTLQATQEIFKQFKKIPPQMQQMPHIQDMFNKAFGVSIEQLQEADQLRKERIKAEQLYLGNLEEFKRQEKEILANKKLTNEERDREIQKAAEALNIDQADYETRQTIATAQEEFNEALSKAKDMFTELVGSGALQMLAEFIPAMVENISSFLGMDFQQKRSDEDIQKELAAYSNSDLEKLGLSREELAKLMEKANLEKGAFGLTNEWAFATNAGIEEARDQLREIRKQAKQNDLDTIKGDTVDAEDFTIKTHPKDTLVMAGGTRFGDETNKLLRELITAVKEGGDVVMDGNKVGYTLSMAGSKF